MQAHICNIFNSTPITDHIAGCHESIFVPQNTAVIAGQRMTMNCPTNNGLIISEWNIQRRSLTTENRLYYNFKNNSRIFNLRFGFDAESNLYVNSTKIDDAGIYTCVARLGSTQQPSRYSAHLIVFGKLLNNSFFRSFRQLIQRPSDIICSWTLPIQVQRKEHANQKDGQTFSILLTQPLTIHDVVFLKCGKWNYVTERGFIPNKRPDAEK